MLDGDWACQRDRNGRIYSRRPAKAGNGSWALALLLALYLIILFWN